MSKIFRPNINKGRKKGGGAKLDTSVPDVILPYTEETADEDTFVCVPSDSANANETGVGGGVDGVNLVLTRNYGSLAAAVNGYRTMATGGGGLNATDAFWTNFLQNATEFTYMVQLKNMNNGGLTTYLLYKWATKLFGSNTQYNAAGFYSNVTLDCQIEDLGILIPSYGDPSTWDGWLVLSKKDSALCCMFRNDAAPPKNVLDLTDNTSDFSLFDIKMHEAGNILDVAHDGTVDAYKNAIIGINEVHSSYGGPYSIGTIVVSKKAIGFPKAFKTIEGLGI